MVEAVGVVLRHGIENKGLGGFHFLSNHAKALKGLDRHT